MAQWYIGQEIVTIKDNPSGLFKIGNVFTIKALHISLCKCNCTSVDIGLRDSSGRKLLLYCNLCHTERKLRDNTLWFHEKNFAPLDELMAEQIEELKLQLTH